MAIETITDNGLSGNRVAKAWAKFTGTGTVSATPDDSFNIASLTDEGTGSYSMEFITPMANVDFVHVAMSSGFHNADYAAHRDVNGFGVQTFNSSHTLADATSVFCVIVGDQ